MDLDGITYIAGTIAALAIVPARIYMRGTLKWHLFPVSLPADPLAPHERDVLAIREHVGYVFADSFLYYGIVNGDEVSVVFGPFREPGALKVDWRETAARLGVAAAQAEDFARGMSSLGVMEFHTALQILCMMDYLMNGEVLRLDDLVIQDGTQENLERELTEHSFREAEFRDPSAAAHSSAEVERVMCDCVRQGKADELRRFFSSLPNFRTGNLSPNRLRHEKNTFIATVTLVSRAAIEGGMDAEEALTLSDTYINKCELMTSYEQVENLMYRMVIGYAEAVARLRLGDAPSSLVLGVTAYVQRHLFEQVRTDDIARALFVSRGFLSTRFKQETGIALADYVQQQKVEEAKRLLRNTSQSLLSISTYLGFSSQSHFNAVFKRHAGMTPREYRSRRI